MSNRVNVRIDVNDMSRGGLRSLRSSLDRMQRDARRAGGDIRFNVRIPDGTARRELRRIQRALRDQNVTITTRLDPPTPPPATVRRRIRRALGGAVRVPVRVTTRGMVGSVRGPLRSLRGLVSGTLQDGVGQGLVQGFKAGGPYGAAVLAAIIISTLALIGAALSGIIITALGAAFVGVGAVSAFQSEQVQKKWKETLGVLKEEFEHVGDPLIPILDKALEKLQDMAEGAGPKLKQALEDTAGSTDIFFQKIMEGFESFGENAFDRIMEAWAVFAPVFGEQWDEFMGELGDAFGDMADLVKEHPTEIAAALEIVFETIELIVRAITFFGEVWVMNMQMAVTAVKWLVDAAAVMIGMILEGLGGILSGAAEAFKWVPGLGGKLADASSAFESFKGGVMEKLGNARDAADKFSKSLDNANKERKLKADISNWKQKLETARADLKKTTSQKAEAKVKANIEQLKQKIAAAERELAGINGRVATTYVDVWQRNRGYAGNSVTGGRRMGGIIGAAAAGGIRGNMTLVGEEGPELVRLPSGSHVRTAGDTRRMLGGSGGGGSVAANLVFKSSGRRVDDLLLEILREAIHQRGGDPVTVLGG